MFLRRLFPAAVKSHPGIKPTMSVQVYFLGGFGWVDSVVMPDDFFRRSWPRFLPRLCNVGFARNSNFFPERLFRYFCGLNGFFGAVRQKSLRFYCGALKKIAPALHSLRTLHLPSNQQPRRFLQMPTHLQQAPTPHPQQSS